MASHELRLDSPLYNAQDPVTPTFSPQIGSPIDPEANPLDFASSASSPLPSPPKTRPTTTRSRTEPGPSVILQQPSTTTPRPSSSHRNRSPFSRSHLRSRSTGATLSVPLVVRAHSSPSIPSTLRPFEPLAPTTGSLSPSSPLRSPARQTSPFRPQEENSTSLAQRSPRWLEASNSNAIESIQEDSELELTPKPQASMPSTMTYHPNVARSAMPRRRPHSPLHSVTSALTAVSFPATIVEHPNTTYSAGSTSPSLSSQRFNEAYPSLHHYASNSSFSSMPSTPTSQRSRSPSISSLDTIEDAPEMETEAIEVERLERLQLAAEKVERAERGEDVDDGPRRSSLDGPRGFGFTRGSNRERKRWSVCGGERRADLDLETIYED